jgi:hypothetical protein
VLINALNAIAGGLKQAHSISSRNLKFLEALGETETKRLQSYNAGYNNNGLDFNILILLKYVLNVTQ